MPDGDLLIAIIAVLVCSAALAAAACRLSRSWSPLLRAWVLLSLVMTTVAYATWGQDAVWIARALDTPLLPVVGRWYPPLVALILGVAWPGWQGSRGREWVLAGSVVALAIYASWHRVIPASIAYRDRWHDGVCLQTMEGTCSAAACASLLRANGIASNEARCARLALTQRDGTTLYGMLRALRVETAGSRYRVRVARAAWEDLHDDRRLPAMLSVVLDAETAAADPRYESQWHWTIGQRHTVVLYGWQDGAPVIGDPAVGRERWRPEGLRALWTGRMVWLAE